MLWDDEMWIPLREIVWSIFHIRYNFLSDCNWYVPLPQPLAVSSCDVSFCADSISVDQQHQSHEPGLMMIGTGVSTHPGTPHAQVLACSMRNQTNSQTCSDYFMRIRLFRWFSEDILTACKLREFFWPSFTLLFRRSELTERDPVKIPETFSCMILYM